jgi:hypothetical protein
MPKSPGFAPKLPDIGSLNLAFFVTNLIVIMSTERRISIFSRE